MAKTNQNHGEKKRKAASKSILMVYVYDPTFHRITRLLKYGIAMQ